MSIGKNGDELETVEILQGFLYSSRQIDANALKLFEATARLGSLIELLVAKGVIGAEELEAHKKQVEERLRNDFKGAGIGSRFADPDIDKYALAGEASIDCERRLPMCRASCCRFAFALSWQDVDEGIRWNLGRPFLNARGSDGYCVHIQRPNFRCGVYHHRPAVCRAYDCRTDRRIWLDFDQMVINPELFGHGGSPPSGIASEAVGIGASVEMVR